jgi:hypothetical protein
LTRFPAEIKRQAERKNDLEKKKEGGATGGMIAPPKGGHAFMDVTSGRKQETGKTGSVIGYIWEGP